MKNETYKKKTIIFSEGDQGSCMYVVAQGKVGIYAKYGTKKEKLLTTLTTEQFFGEMAIIDNEPRSATAVALEETVLIPIQEDQLLEYGRKKPHQLLAIMQSASDRLRSLTKEYLAACDKLAEYYG